MSWPVCYQSCVCVCVYAYIPTLKRTFGNQVHTQAKAMVGDTQLHVSAVKTETTRGLAWATWCAEEAVMGLVYSLATPGSSVISTACLFVFDGCQVDCGQTIFLQQPQPFEPTRANLRPSPGQNSGHPMGSHNNRTVTVAAAPGTEQRST